MINPMTYAIIKKHVDRLDRMGFLAMGAPGDEYDLESRMIAQRITDGMSPPQIAALMAEVFSESFSQSETTERFAETAQRIHADLHP